MDDIVAVTFEHPDHAYIGLTRLKELDDQGQIALLEAGVIERDAQRRLLVKDTVDDHDRPVRDTLEGGAEGLLIGALGGPIGLLVGVMAGGILGAAADLSPKDEADGVLATYARHIGNGQTAVLAHVQEPNGEIVDAAMSALGGSVLRDATSDVSAELKRAA